ncbi:phage tail assembly protein [Klebsiella pneumoniae]|uniref:phage tail assembly protein n=1 Tax=Klebsiella pneumoniae TaxID=573 RepID=UPI000DE94FC1|nr:phage tail assembly protein [Klebsiella pneumoniae]RBZ49710.1 phage tail assembly protein [Klebsiella pneumoniae]
MSEKTVATVKLDSPITRGDATITEIVLRSTRLQAVMEMDVASMMTVIPRISTPTLTPQEMADLDPADLAAMSIEVVLFLLPKSAFADLPTA